MTDKQQADQIAAIILGRCYASQTSAVRIEFASIAYDYFEDESVSPKVEYVFSWLEREGMVRCLNKRKSLCVEAEITSKGKRLLRDNDAGNRLVKAIADKSIDFAASLAIKVIDML